MYSYGPPHMAVQKQDDQPEHTFSNYVRIRDVVLKTCLGRWTIGRSGERGSGISVLPARHDDDVDDDVYICTHTHTTHTLAWCVCVCVCVYVCRVTPKNWLMTKIKQTEKYQQPSSQEFCNDCIVGILSQIWILYTDLFTMFIRRWFFPLKW